MADYYDELDPDYYEIDKQRKRYEYLMGAGTGAATGASIGTQINPGKGTAIGAGIGAAAGAGIAHLSLKEQQRLLDEAYERDLEVQKRIEGVAHLEPFLESQAVLSAGKREEAEVGARQAAARGGLSTAAGEEFARGAEQNIALQESTALAAAVPAAARADIAERDRIVREEMGRQDLFDRATQGPDWMGELGALGGTAAAVAGQATAAGGVLEGGAGAAAKDITPEEYNAMNPDEQMAALNALDTPVGDRGLSLPQRREAPGREPSPVDTSVDEEGLAYDDARMRYMADEENIHTTGTGRRRPVASRVVSPEGAAPDYGFYPGEIDQLDQQAEMLSTEEDLIAERRAVVSDLQAVRSKGDELMAREVPDGGGNVEDLIANDLQTGAVSQNEFEAIIAANPNALTDYNIWMNQVNEYREGAADLGPPDPGLVNLYSFGADSGVSPSTIDALIR